VINWQLPREETDSESCVVSDNAPVLGARLPPLAVPNKDLTFTAEIGVNEYTEIREQGSRSFCKTMKR